MRKDCLLENITPNTRCLSGVDCGVWMVNAQNMSESGGVVVGGFIIPG